MANTNHVISLQVQANTTQAKQEIQKLLKTLNDVQHANLGSPVFTKNMQQAASAAQQLSLHLKNATDVNTGNINLNAFHQSIQNANLSFSTLVNNLRNSGQLGQQAFNQLATALAQAQTPLKQHNTLLTSMLTSLKNTIKWQISSSLMKGVISGFSTAVGYARDLNSSLNNIRIVTGQSVEQMARFAEQANKAAKSLSTTTKAYTDAALIYYQQGDKDDLVQRKAAITTKAANASFGSSVKEMSEYLTAVWNSYQVGADELERYVDIMAALGANTATSLEEIATSMQKVAATANTVGVSMEQVSSIISTVSSVTRESAESIGTAYKTIFARIGDLKLGETLEDGVHLGQVSSQLAKIGVNILDTNGAMRDMGTIIEELMSKWNSLGRAEQTAIAQVVAGKRQYTQLMALMENRDKYNQAMNVAQSADGTLNDMSNTYAESWEAASKRVRTALESIYTSIFQDEAIIDFLNIIESVVSSVGKLVKQMGGLKGVLSSIGGIATAAFAPMMNAKLQNLFGGIAKAWVNPNRQQIKWLNNQANELAASRTRANNPDNSLTTKYTEQAMREKARVLALQPKMSAEQMSSSNLAIEGLMQQISLLRELESEYQSSISTLQQYNAEAKKMPGMTQTTTTARTNQGLRFMQPTLGNKASGATIFQHALEATTREKMIENPMASITNTTNSLLGMNAGMPLLGAFGGGATGQAALDGLLTKINMIKAAIKGTQAESKLTIVNPQTIQDLRQLQVELNTIMADAQSDAAALRAAFQRVVNALPNGAAKTQLQSLLDGMDAEAQQVADKITTLNNGLDMTKGKITEIRNATQEFGKTMQTAVTSITQMLSGLLQAVTIFNTVKNISSQMAQGEEMDWTSTVTVGVIGLITLLPMLNNAISTTAAVASGAATLIQASFGWISLILAAATMIGSAIYAISKGEEEGKEKARLESSKVAQESTRKQIDTNTELLKSNQELITSFNELYAAQAAGEDVAADLAKRAAEIAAAYGLESSAVAALSGNYEDFFNQIRNGENVTDIGMYEAAVRSARGNIINNSAISDAKREKLEFNEGGDIAAIRAGYGGKNGNNFTFQPLAGSQYSYIGNRTAASWLSKYDNLYTHRAVSGTMRLLLSSSDSFEYKLNTYEDLLALYEELDGQNLEYTEFAQSIKDILDTMEPEIKAYKDALKNLEDARIANVAKSWVGRVENINFSFDDFIALYETTESRIRNILSENYSGDELDKQVRATMQAIMDTNDGVATYATAIQAALEIFNYDMAQASSAVTAIVEQYGFEAIDAIVLQMYKNNPNSNAWQTYAQHRQDSVRLNKQTNFYNDFAELEFDDDMTYAEMQTFYEEYETARKNAYEILGIELKTFDDLMTGSFEARTAYMALANQDLLILQKQAALDTQQSAQAVYDTYYVDGGIDPVTGKPIKLYAFDSPDMNVRMTARQNAGMINQTLSMQDWNDIIAQAAQTSRLFDQVWSSAFALNSDGSWEIAEGMTLGDLRQLPGYQELSTTLRYIISDFFALLMDNSADHFAIDYETIRALANPYFYHDSATSIVNVQDRATHLALWESVANAESEDAAVDTYFGAPFWGTYRTRGEQIVEDAERAMAWQTQADEATTNLETATAIVSTITATIAQVESLANSFKRLATAINTLPASIDDFIATAKDFNMTATQLANSSIAERAYAFMSSVNAPDMNDQRFQYNVYINSQDGSTIGEVAYQGLTQEKKALYQQSTAIDYASYHQALNEYNTGMQTAFETLVKGENYTNLTEGITQLTNSYLEFINTGEMAVEVQNALRMNGIDPATISSVEDYTQALIELGQNLVANAKYAEVMYELKYDTTYDRNQIWDPSQMSSQQYKIWSEVSELYNEIDVMQEQLNAAYDQYVEQFYKGVQTRAEQFKEELQEAVSDSEQGLSLLNTYLNNITNVSFKNIESLRQALEGAGVAAENINNIINKLTGTNVTEIEKIETAMLASLDLALAGASAQEAEARQIKELSGDDPWAGIPLTQIYEWYYHHDESESDVPWQGMDLPEALEWWYQYNATKSDNPANHESYQLFAQQAYLNWSFDKLEEAAAGDNPASYMTNLNGVLTVGNAVFNWSFQRTDTDLSEQPPYTPEEWNAIKPDVRKYAWGYYISGGLFNMMFGKDTTPPSVEEWNADAGNINPHQFFYSVSEDDEHPNGLAEFQSFLTLVKSFGEEGENGKVLYNLPLTYSWTEEGLNEDGTGSKAPKLDKTAWDLTFKWVGPAEGSATQEDIIGPLDDYPEGGAAELFYAYRLATGDMDMPFEEFDTFLHTLHETSLEDHGIEDFDEWLANEDYQNAAFRTITFNYHWNQTIGDTPLTDKETLAIYYYYTDSPLDGGQAMGSTLAQLREKHSELIADLTAMPPLPIVWEYQEYGSQGGTAPFEVFLSTYNQAYQAYKEAMEAEEKIPLNPLDWFNTLSDTDKQGITNLVWFTYDFAPLNGTPEEKVAAWNASNANNVITFFYKLQPLVTDQEGIDPEEILEKQQLYDRYITADTAATNADTLVNFAGATPSTAASYTQEEIEHALQWFADYDSTLEDTLRQIANERSENAEEILSYISPDGTINVPSLTKAIMANQSDHNSWTSNLLFTLWSNVKDNHTGMDELNPTQRGELAQYSSDPFLYSRLIMRGFVDPAIVDNRALYPDITADNFQYMPYIHNLSGWLALQRLFDSSPETGYLAGNAYESLMGAMLPHEIKAAMDKMLLAHPEYSAMVPENFISENGLLNFELFSAEHDAFMQTGEMSSWYEAFLNELIASHEAKISKMNLPALRSADKQAVLDQFYYPDLTYYNAHPFTPDLFSIATGAQPGTVPLTPEEIKRIIFNADIVNGMVSTADAAIDNGITGSDWIWGEFDENGIPTPGSVLEYLSIAETNHDRPGWDDLFPGEFKDQWNDIWSALQAEYQMFDENGDINIEHLRRFVNPLRGLTDMGIEGKLSTLGVPEEYFNIDFFDMFAAVGTDNSAMANFFADKFPIEGFAFDFWDLMADLIADSEDGEMTEISLMLIRGLADGLKTVGGPQMASMFLSALQGLGLKGAVYDAFATELEIHSPSELTKRLAPYLIAGLVNGLKQAVNDTEFTQAVAGLGLKIANALLYELEQAKDLTETEASAYASIITTALKGIGITDLELNATEDFNGKELEDIPDVVVNKYKAKLDEISSPNKTYTSEAEAEAMLEKFGLKRTTPGVSITPHTQDTEQGEITVWKITITDEAKRAAAKEVTEAVNPAIITQFGYDWVNGGYKTDPELSDYRKKLIEDAVSAYTAKTGQSITKDNWQDFITWAQSDAYWGATLDNISDKQALLWSEFTDTWDKGLEQIIQTSQEAAEQEYSLWVNTFTAIAKARQAILSNKSIMDELNENEIKALIDGWLSLSENPKTASEMLRLLRGGADSNNFDNLNDDWDADAFFGSKIAWGFLRANEDQDFLSETPPSAAVYNKRVYDSIYSQDPGVNSLFNYFNALIGTRINQPYINELVQKRDQGDGEAAMMLAYAMEKGWVTAGTEGQMLLASDATIDFTNEHLGELLQKAFDAYAVNDDKEASAIWRDAFYEFLVTQNKIIDGQMNQYKTQRESAQSDLELIQKAMQGEELNADEQWRLNNEILIEGETLAQAFARLAQAADNAALQMKMMEEAKQQGLILGDDGLWYQTSGVVDENNQPVYDITTATFSVDANATPEQVWRAYAETYGIDSDHLAKMRQDSENYVLTMSAPTLDENSIWRTSTGRIIRGAQEPQLLDGETFVSRPDQQNVWTLTARTQQTQETLFNGNGVLTPEALWPDGNIPHIDGLNWTPEAILSTAASQLSMTNDELREYIDLLEGMDEGLDFDLATAEGMAHAVNIARITKEAGDGLTALRSDWSKTLGVLKKETKVSTAELAKTMSSFRKNMAKIFNVDEALFDDDFIDKNLDNFDKLMEGTEDEAKEAGKAIEKALLEKTLQVAEKNKMIIDIDSNGIQNELAQAQSYFDAFLAQNADAEVGTTVSMDTSAALSGLNNLLSAGAMTAEGITAALNAIGWEPQIEWTPVTAEEYSTQNMHGGYYMVNGNYVPVDGQVDATNTQTIYIPKIKGATRTGSGARAPGMNPGGGGGGGGGGKPKKVDRKDPNDEKERYHEINQRLERTSQLLDKVAKYKDRAYGKGYLKNIEQEIKLLEQEEVLYANKLEEAKQWLEFDKQRLAQYGATYDAQGNINNYDEMLDAAIAEYNAYVDKYNAMTAEQQKAEDENEVMKDYEEKIEDLKKYISDYEDSLNNIYELENQLEEQRNKKSALHLEKIQYKVEYQIEINDDDVALLEYFDKIWEDSIEKQDERLDGYIKKSSELQDNLEILAEAQKELDAAYANGELTLADYVEGLRDVKDQIIDNLEALEELQDTINELYGDVLDMISEEVTEQTDHINAATEAMGSYVSILGLLGRGKNFREMETFFERQVAYGFEAAKAQKQHLDVLLEEKEYYDNIIASGQELNETQQIWYADLLNAIDEANSELLSSTEEVLNNIQAEYENMINAIFKELDEKMGGVAGSIAGLADEYAYYTETQERYVTSARELYEVSKLNRDIEKSIEDTTTSASKKMLVDLKERINAQSELNELTEYDIEMNRLQYELALAKIQLEEAENAKSTVRLTRTENGDYAYQYTTDNDKINEAQQQYEDVLQQINDLAYNRVTELEQMFLDAQQQYYEAAQEIALDTTLTVEERTIKLQELYARFCETQGYIQEQYQNATGHLMESNTVIAAHYGETLTAQAMTTHENINTTIGGMIEDNDRYKESFRQAIDEINAKQQEQQEKMDQVAAAIGVDYGSMIQNVSDYDEAVDDAATNVSTLLMGNGEVQGMLDQIKELGTAWGDFVKNYLDNVISKFEALAQEIQACITNLAELKGEVADSDYVVDTGDEPSEPPTPAPEPETPPEIKPPSNSGGDKYFAEWHNKSGTFTGKQNAENAIARWKNEYRAHEEALVSAYATPGGQAYNYAMTQINNFINRTDGKITKVYKTGGLADYTGPAWVDGTKSQPELVLNAHDTANMITALGTLRELDTDAIALLVSSLNAATASLFSMLNGNYHASGIRQLDDQVLQQNVEIHADFPNVQDKNEIIDAIDDLVNRASQYAQKKMW